jgi:hypothetical protein
MQPQSGASKALCVLVVLYLFADLLVLSGGRFSVPVSSRIAMHVRLALSCGLYSITEFRHSSQPSFGVSCFCSTSLICVSSSQSNADSLIAPIVSRRNSSNPTRKCPCLAEAERSNQREGREVNVLLSMADEPVRHAGNVPVSGPAPSPGPHLGSGTGVGHPAIRAFDRAGGGGCSGRKYSNANCGCLRAAIITGAGRRYRSG